MKITLGKLINQFLKWADAALAENTVKAYRHHLRRFLRAAKNKRCDRLRPVHLTAWGKSWHDYQAVVRLFNWAVDEAGLLKRNPFKRVRMPARSQRNRILEPKEMVRVLRGARAPGRAFLLALRESLARPQEIRMARFSDLHAEDSTTPIDQALTTGRAVLVLREFKDRRRRKETNRPRVLVISRRLGRMIVRLRARNPDGQSHIWLNTLKRPLSSNAVRCLMRRLRRRLGLVADADGENIVAYTFRHSCATLAAAKGVVDRLLADLLGHVETRTTARYIHLRVEHLRAAMDRLDTTH